MGRQKTYRPIFFTCCTGTCIPVQVLRAWQSPNDVETLYNCEVLRKHLSYSFGNSVHYLSSKKESNIESSAQDGCRKSPDD